jgi:hypothetical protein
MHGNLSKNFKMELILMLEIVELKSQEDKNKE